MDLLLKDSFMTLLKKKGAASILPNLNELRDKYPADKLRELVGLFEKASKAFVGACRQSKTKAKPKRYSS